MRPNLHIKDMCDFYEYLIEADSKLVGAETFNISDENISIENIALKIQSIFLEKFDTEINIKKIASEDDKRSYHLNSSKIKEKLDFTIKYKVEDAILDIYSVLNSGKYKDSLENDIYYNIKTLKKLNIT